MAQCENPAREREGCTAMAPEADGKARVAMAETLEIAGETPVRVNP
jgi:hypothetical protein